jgi:hypothetical protein
MTETVKAMLGSRPSALSYAPSATQPCSQRIARERNENGPRTNREQTGTKRERYALGAWLLCVDNGAAVWYALGKLERE